jgi:hypothetical protein
MWILLAAAALGLFYAFPIRAWFRHWGATGSELTRAMPCDTAVAHASYATTLAVTVTASPEDIWPWLLQMGYQRGGLYSYDWLDRLFGYLDRPSADRILPEFQRLEVGDEIPVGGSPGFPVIAIEPERALILGGESDGFEWVWQFGLYPIDSSHTRLVSRNRAAVPNTVGWWLFMRVLEPAAFLMTRRMLLGLARRAEALARGATASAPGPVTREAEPQARARRPTRRAPGGERQCGRRARSARDSRRSGSPWR